MKRLLGTAVLALGATASLMAQGNNVSVYTDKRVAGALPPTGAATSNTLFLQIPDATAADKNGNVFVTDTGGHRVWKIDPTGKPTLVIGTGAFGGPTFGRAANTQAIGEPSGLAVDADGNLYIADRNNARIYKVDTAGVVTLVAGVAGNGRFSGDGRLAIFSDINSPRGLTIGPDGNLYFADTGNQRIRKIDLKTGIITTVAGRSTGGSATGTGFSGDGGLATKAQMNNPEAVAFDALGDMFIADTGNNRIRMVDPTGIITTVAGRDLTNRELGKDDNGNPIKNPITGSNYSAATAPYANSCTFQSAGNASTTRVGLVLPTTTATGNTVCALVGDGRDPLAALLASPRGIVVDANNNVIFVDAANARIRMLVANPVPAGTNSSAGFSGIITIVGSGSSGNAGDGGNGKFATISTIPSGGATTNGASGLFLDANGRLFFTDRTNNRVRVFDTVGGLITGFAGAPNFNGDQAALDTMLNTPEGVAVDLAGNVYFTDTGNNLIRKIDAVTGRVVTIAGVRTGGDAASEGIDPTTAAFSRPTGIWVDSSGTTIYVVDEGSKRVRRISGGAITTVAGCTFTRATPTSSLSQNCSFTSDGLPATVINLNFTSGTNAQSTKRFSGVAVDSKGVIYFAESGNHVIRKVLIDGTIVTIAGQYGTEGSGGDGGKAVDMFLSTPSGVAVDANGVIAVADARNLVAHLIANGIAYPLAGQIGSSSNDAETANNQGGVAVPAFNKRYRVIQGVAFDTIGNVYVSDTTDNKIDRIPYAAPAACIPATGTTCPANSSLYVDYRVSGNNSNTANDFVFDYTAPASATAVASTVQLSFPMGLAVDSKGDVFFADSANNLIREAVAPAPAK